MDNKTIYLNGIKIYNYCGDDREIFLRNINKTNKSNYPFSHDNYSTSYVNNDYFLTDLINNNLPDTYNKEKELI